MASSAPHMSTPPLGSIAQSDPQVRNVCATVPSAPETSPPTSGAFSRPSSDSSWPKIAVSLMSPLSRLGTVFGIPSIGPAMSTYTATCFAVHRRPPPPPPSRAGVSTQFRKYRVSWSP